MRKFNKTLRGYNPIEVNAFVEEVINQVENMVKQLNQKDSDINNLKERLSHYQNIEGTLNRALFAAEQASDQIKKVARQETTMLIDDARKNANRIVNEALMKAEKAEYEAALIQKNVTVFKRRLRSIIESQLEVIDDIEKIEM